MAIIWPEILRPRHIVADPVPRNLSPTISASGRRQVVSSSAPAWRVTFAEIPVHGPDRVNTWRAISALAEGSLTPIIVPLFHTHQSIYEGAFGTAPHSDDAPHSDGSPFDGGAVDCHLSSGIVAGAVTAQVAYRYGEKLQPGQTFSIDNRAYRVKAVTTTGDNQTITFTPPARQAHASGLRVDIDRPMIRVRLADDAAMSIRLDFDRWSFPTLDFVEDL